MTNLNIFSDAESLPTCERCGTTQGHVEYTPLHLELVYDMLCRPCLRDITDNSKQAAKG